MVQPPMMQTPGYPQMGMSQHNQGVSLYYKINVAIIIFFSNVSIVKFLYNAVIWICS
jgi:hypothetical protein